MDVRGTLYEALLFDLSWLHIQLSLQLVEQHSTGRRNFKPVLRIRFPHLPRSRGTHNTLQINGRLVRILKLLTLQLVQLTWPGMAVNL